MGSACSVLLVALNHDQLRAFCARRLQIERLQIWVYSNGEPQYLRVVIFLTFFVIEVDPKTTDGHHFRVKAREDLASETPVVLFLRPEAMLIAPEAGLADLNRFKVSVKSILFDGANSRLLVTPAHSDREITADREMLVALPQNRQFDYIQPNDTVEIGWDVHSGICFPAKGECA